MSLNPFDTPADRLRSGLHATRRQFLGIMGAIAGVGSLAFGGIMTLKFMFPNSTLEDPPQFKVGTDPSQITVGQPAVISAKRVTVVKDSGGYYAVFLVCTHLGCTPNYVSDVSGGSGNDAANAARAKQRGLRDPNDQLPNGWECPCHGSRYFIDSTNFFGPAPRPMDWVQVTKAPDGKLLVDRSQIVVMRNPGDTTPPTWRLDYESGNAVHVDQSKLVKS